MANLNIKTKLTGGTVDCVDRNTASMKVNGSLCWTIINGAVLCYSFESSSLVSANGVSVIIPYGQSPGTPGRWIMLIPDIPGSIRSWPAIIPPSGWLVRDGSAISRTAYPELFAVLGTTFGAGNGSTTFNLPDDRGRVIAGYKSGDTYFGTFGALIGESTHTLTEAEMPVHNHAQEMHRHDLAGYQTLGGGGLPQFSAAVVNSAGASTTYAQPYIYPAGGGAAHGNIQPSRVYLPIIKY